MYDLKNYSEHPKEHGTARILKKFKFGKDIFYGCKVENDKFYNNMSKEKSDTNNIVNMNDIYYV